MNGPRRHPDDLVLIPRLGEQDVVLVIESLERLARDFERSAAELPAAFTQLKIRDLAGADRCRRLAERLNRLRQAMLHKG